MAAELAASFPAPAGIRDGRGAARAIEPEALRKLSYGLFVLTAREGGRDNGCIVNTALQLTASPVKIAVAVSKANYTHDMIARTGAFNLSVLTEQTPFGIFEQFGLKSGRDGDKFAPDGPVKRTANGLRYVPEFANSVLSAQVEQSVDCGTHTLFTAEVTQADALSDAPSATYQYYFDHIKPKPQTPRDGEKGYVCRICGYVYPGDPLPDDFICPLCKHGAEDFEPVQ